MSDKKITDYKKNPEEWDRTKFVALKEIKLFCGDQTGHYTLTVNVGDEIYYEKTSRYEANVFFWLGIPDHIFDYRKFGYVGGQSLKELILDGFIRKVNEDTKCPDTVGWG